MHFYRTAAPDSAPPIANRCTRSARERWRRRAVLTWGVAVCVPALVGCTPDAPPGPHYGSAPVDATPVYRLAVHPLHNPRKLDSVYAPLLRHLETHIPGARFELEASRDYQAFEAKLNQNGPDLILPNPWQTLKARHAGYRVLAMAGNTQDFSGLIIVRRDSGIGTASDLRGKSMSCPSPTALAACLMPQRALFEQGVHPRRDMTLLYVGSQESSIMHTLQGRTAAAATWPLPWRAFQRDHPQDAAQLTVLLRTPSLPNNAVMAHARLPAELAARVQTVLLDLGRDEAGRALLRNMDTAGFFAAQDADYQAVRQFIERFEREIGPVEGQR